MPAEPLERLRHGPRKRPGTASRATQFTERLVEQRLETRALVPSNTLARRGSRSLLSQSCSSASRLLHCGCSAIGAGGCAPAGERPPRLPRQRDLAAGSSQVCERRRLAWPALREHVQSAPRRRTRRAPPRGDQQLAPTRCSRPRSRAAARSANSRTTNQLAARLVLVAALAAPLGAKRGSALTAPTTEALPRRDSARAAPRSLPSPRPRLLQHPHPARASTADGRGRRTAPPERRRTYDGARLARPHDLALTAPAGYCLPRACQSRPRCARTQLVRRDRLRSSSRSPPPARQPLRQRHLVEQQHDQRTERGGAHEEDGSHAVHGCPLFRGRPGREDAPIAPWPREKRWWWWPRRSRRRSHTVLHGAPISTSPTIPKPKRNTTRPRRWPACALACQCCEQHQSGAY